MKHIAANCSQHLRKPMPIQFRLMMASAVVFAFLGSASAQTAIPPAGSGAQGDPYQITVLGNLVWMNDTVTSSSGKYYKLMNDIDASETAAWDSGKGFVPIGSETTPFEGTFDGNNKKITGLTINRPDTDYIGLFGSTYDSTVNNLGLEDFTIAGRKRCGGLAGSMSALSSSTLCVTNCYTSGSVSGTYNCGGLVGYQEGCAVSDCYSSGSVSGHQSCGGLVGYQKGCAISDCYSSGSMRSIYYCGGLVGAQESCAISDCYSSGSVSGTYNCGGLIGYQQGGSVSNCYATGDVSGTGQCGGLVAFQNSGTITGCYSTGSVSSRGYGYGGGYCGGLVGQQGGSISNCYSTGSVTSTGDCSGGLVGQQGGSVSNCYSTGSVSGTSNCGGLVGRQSNAAITNCYSSGSVSGTSSCGGLVGWQDNGTITNCYSTGSVTSTGNYSGGLVGYQRNGTITNCYSSARVSGRDYSGGLVGQQGGSISNCYSAGDVSGNRYCGGLVGRMDSGSISDCYASGSVTSTDNYCGGLVGYIYSGSISTCYSSGRVRGGDYCGGLVGSCQNYEGISNCYYDRETSGQRDANKGTPKTTAEMRQQATFSGWDFANVWKIVEETSYPYLSVFCGEDCDLTLSVVGMGTIVPDAGTTVHSYGAVVSLSAVAADNYVFGEWIGGFVADPTSPNTTVHMDSSKSVTARFRKVYEIRTLSELQAVNDDLAGYYILMNDIDASETAGWDGGKGFVPIGSYTTPFEGVFDGNNKKITGLTINRPNANNIGLFGMTCARSMIKNLGLEDFTIVGGGYCGGVAGYVSALSSSTPCVTNCYTIGSVSGTGGCGGLVGCQVFGSINNCHSDGSVSGSSWYCGGLVGYQEDGSISNCYSTGSVSGGSNCGGLVGRLFYGSIGRCYASGSVSGTRGCGGLIGYVFSGITGNCYASGSVSGTSGCGGLVGDQHTGFISNCYATGRVTCTESFGGGLVDFATSVTISDCYYDTETSGKSDTGKGTPKTTAEMKQQATFSGWDFTTVWSINEGVDYPKLRSVGSLKVTISPEGAVAAGAQWSINGGATWNASGATVSGLPPADYTVTYKTIPGWEAPAPQTVTITEGVTTTVTGIYIDSTPKVPSGSGTEEDPYQITVVGNLVWMGDTVTSSSGKYYKLMNDIDASETAAWDGGKGFVPIGNDTTPFEGIFDGNNKKITGLTIKRPDRKLVGLFGRTYPGSMIKDLDLEDFTIVGGEFSGGLVGYVDSGSISNCYSSGSVSGTYNCGGLVGQFRSGSISNCYSTAGVSGNGSCGGLLGSQVGGSISNSYSSGSVSGVDYCGGLVGAQMGGSISNCYSSGSVSGNGNCGGLLGYQNNSSISNCYSSGSVSGTGGCGGLVGFQNVGGAIANCYSTGRVSSAGNDCGGLVGCHWGGSIDNCYYDTETSGQSDTGKGAPKTTAEMKQQATFSGWDFAAIWGILENQTYPYLLSLTPSGSLQVTILPAEAVTAGAQWSISGGVTWHDSGTTVTGLPVSDYTVTYKTIPDWTTPAPQTVTITDGGITTAIGIYVDPTMPSGSGTAEDPYRITVLDNLVWMGNTVGSSSGKYYKLMNDIDASETAAWDGGKGFVPIGEDGREFLGIFDGNNKKITGLTIDRPDTNYIGLFGKADIGSLIKNLGLEDFTIVGGKFSGSLAGAVSALSPSTLCVTNCYTSGSVSSSNTQCGGLIGFVQPGSISNCYVTGDVSGGNFCGGLVGSQWGGSISNCYSTGSVSGHWAGGGLVGRVHSVSISNCYSTGSVSGTGSVFGGLVGYQDGDGSISNCYSTGGVSGTDDEYGGLVGRAYFGSISNCYSTGSVSGNNYCGGLVGSVLSVTISDCYYDRETSGQSDDAGKGTPKTTAEMKQQATFSGWDFAAIWGILENQTYPYLRSLTPSGSLQVTLVPAEAVAAGAQWSINGGATWNASGATVSGLPPADYTVTYKTIPGWEAPAPVNVTVTAGTTSSITGAYALKTFTITSNCGPNGTISPKGVFSVNYGSSKTYTITPDKFCSVREVKVDGVNVGAVTSYTFENVTADHTIVATFHGPLDIVLPDGDFTAGTDTSLAPGAAVDLSWTVSASRPVSDPVWFEVFGSRTGGFDQVRIGAALTSSYKKQDDLGTSVTVKPNNLKLNPVPDGLYTLVPSVNRGNLSGAVGEADYTNNWLPIAGKRLSVHNPNLSDIDLIVSDVLMAYDAGQPTKVKFTGKIRNVGSENLVKPGCWVEVFYGTLTAEGALMPQGTIGAGVKIETLAAGASADFTLSGTVPAGVQNRALAVVADSTDIVPEIDETNNVYLTYDPSILPAGKSNGIDLAITGMTVNEAQLAPHSIAPGNKLNFTVTVRNKGTVAPSQKVYLEVFASQDGGLSNVPGVTVTWSEQITAPALGATKTYTLSKTLNSIGDGMYTLVATVNRTGLGVNPGDQTPLDNRFKYAAGRIFLKTPATSGGTNNIEWVSGPTFTQNGTQMTVAGTIKNTGTAATRAFWTEAFIGTVQAKTGVFYKDTNLVFCAGDNCPGLAAGATRNISLTGTVPSGKVVGVLADSTDVVAETDETDNYDYSGLTN